MYEHHYNALIALFAKLLDINSTTPMPLNWSPWLQQISLAQLERSHVTVNIHSDKLFNDWIPSVLMYMENTAIGWHVLR